MSTENAAGAVTTMTTATTKSGTTNATTKSGTGTTTITTTKPSTTGTSGTTGTTATGTTGTTATGTTDTSSPVRNCIVAMDGSEHADYALEWYLHHIHRPGDHVVLVYVPELNDVLHSTKWTTSAVYQFDRELMEAMLKEEQARIRQDLDKFAEKLRHHGLGGKVKSVMACKPGEGIIKAAEEEHAHIIITGSRGLGQLRRTFLGSVSDYLVHHAHIPVLVCKHPHKHVHERDDKKPDDKKPAGAVSSDTAKSNK